MVNYRSFQFSHDLFWGFKRQIDLDEVNSLQECIDMMYIKLFELLKRENFVTLIEKLEANREQLHIHGMEFGDILISDIDIIILYL